MSSEVLRNKNILSAVLTFLPLEDHSNFCRTNSRFNEIAGTPEAAERVFRLMLRTVTNPQIGVFEKFTAKRLHKPEKPLVLLKQMSSLSSLHLAIESDRTFLNVFLSFQNARNLSCLDVSFGSLNIPICLDYIASNCPELEELHLHGLVAFTDVDGRGLSQLKKLQKITLCGGGIGRTTLAALSKIPTLTNIDLTDCFHVEPADLGNLLQSLPHLQTLGIGGFRREGKEHRLSKAVSNHGQNLTSLSLTCSPDPADAIVEMVKACPKLQTLNLERAKCTVEPGAQNLQNQLKNASPNLQVKGLQP